MCIRVQPLRVLIDGVVLGVALLACATCFLNPEQCPSKDAPCLAFIVRSTQPFTITFRGHNYADSGGAKDFSYVVERVPLGRNELTGSTSADTISIRFIGIGYIANGGVSAASLESVEGSGASVRRDVCMVRYSPAAGTPLPYTLRIRFDVVPNPPAC